MFERVFDSGPVTASPDGKPATSPTAVHRLVAVVLDPEGQPHTSDLEQKTADQHITVIDAGQHSALALAADGRIIGVTWDGYGQCNTDLAAAAANKHVTAVAVGDEQSLVLTARGDLIAAGEGVDNLKNQVANKDLTEIAAAWYACLALTHDGEVIGWGAGTFEQAPNLAARTKGDRITTIAVGWYTSLAITEDGKVIGAGEDKYGAISDLVEKTKDKRVTAVAVGQWQSLALTEDGQVIGAGRQYHGEVTKLVEQTADKRVTAIAAAAYYSLALTVDGQILAAGDSKNGLTSTLQARTRGRKVTAIAAGDTYALALVEQPPRRMVGQAAVAGLPGTDAPHEIGTSGVHHCAGPASQRTTVTGDGLRKGDHQSVQVSHGESNLATTLSGTVRTVRGTVGAATAQAGTHAPLVASLTGMSLDVTVTSTDEGSPSSAVRLTFEELTINGQQQSTTPGANTVVSLDNGGKAILNHQQPDDSGIDVTAVALFDGTGREVMRLGHVSAHLPIDSAEHAANVA